MANHYDSETEISDFYEGQDSQEVQKIGVGCQWPQHSLSQQSSSQSSWRP